MVAKIPPANPTPQWCPTCGAKLLGGDCVECDRPRSMRGAKIKVATVRGYEQPADEAKEPGVDARRASSEWLTQPTDEAPSTRKAHPTQVRQALAEAEEKARQSAEIRIASLKVSRPTTRPRAGRPESRKSTSPRVKATTPVPEVAPEVHVEPVAAAAPGPAPVSSEASPRAEPIPEPARREPPTHPGLAAVGGMPVGAMGDGGGLIGPRLWFAAAAVLVLAGVVALALH